VDTPKGDLDSSDSVEGPDVLLVRNSEAYPYGTTEQFPRMEDSGGRVLAQSAHAYAECANAGLCNRTSGVCDCFEGFGGAACQRMKCPGSPTCSGHGTCQTLKRIAEMDYHSYYYLWDKNTIQGCVCDPGFYGGDCAQRRCKRGLDPLYLDDQLTVQVPSFFFTIMTNASRFDLTDGFAQPKPGYWRMKVRDGDGGSWLTTPIPADGSCDDIIAGLEGIPQRVIPPGQTVCYETVFDDLDPYAQNTTFRIRYDALYQLYFGGTKSYEIATVPAVDAFGYRVSYGTTQAGDVLLAGKLFLVQFFGNLGDFGQPEINTHQFDGMRPSLAARNGTVVARAWTNGQQGFSTDYFTDHCDEVKVKLKTVNGQGFFWGALFESENLRRCLGTSDHDSTNDEFDLEFAPYDLGTPLNPHLVRLVREQSDDRDGGFFAAVYFDKTSQFIGGSGEMAYGAAATGAWRLMNPVVPLDNEDGLYRVYATQGVLRATDARAGATFRFGSNQIYTHNTSFDLSGGPYDGDITCEAAGLSGGAASAASRAGCLDKNDKFVLLDPYTPAHNPPYMNLYTARSIQRFHDSLLDTNDQVYAAFNVSAGDRGSLTSRFRKNLITADLNVNWANEAVGASAFHVYKFSPGGANTYKYIAECSNRGLCNTFEGTCDCFFGYSGESCEAQNTVIF